mmetsp:Transcript_17236/g.34966  ORF Transcript_17236/g.34966 Transcript_17236/m.34966 type:complete len:297 (+) Transcript_17236:405-1295(+)
MNNFAVSRRTSTPLAPSLERELEPSRVKFRSPSPTAVFSGLLRFPQTCKTAPTWLLSHSPPTRQPQCHKEDPHPAKAGPDVGVRSFPPYPSYEGTATVPSGICALQLTELDLSLLPLSLQLGMNSLPVGGILPFLLYCSLSDSLPSAPSEHWPSPHSAKAHVSTPQSIPLPWPLNVRSPSQWIPSDALELSPSPLPAYRTLSAMPSPAPIALSAASTQQLLRLYETHETFRCAPDLFAVFFLGGTPDCCTYACHPRVPPIQRQGNVTHVPVGASRGEARGLWTFLPLPTAHQQESL